MIDGAEHGAALVGGKGASLDRLVAAGQRVPPTGVVTVATYEAVAGDAGVSALLGAMEQGATPSAAEVDAVFARAILPDPAIAEIHAVASRVAGGGRLAVRSSATVEDLAGSSFAGQYRSVLDVDPGDRAALETAVRQVFASLWHPAPRAYRAAFGIGASGAAMAVVLMRMVPASTAGVVFTADPGGTEDAARIEVVAGLGESLVSGQRTPEAFVVDRLAPASHLRPDVRAALTAAMAVEEAEGTPQDVEWAWDGAELWLVQARPITVRAEGDGFDSPVDDHELTTAGIGEMLPGVLSPRAWDLNAVLVNNAFAHLVAGLGAPEEDLDARPFVRRVHGRAALDFTRLRRLAEDLPGGSGEELEAQYFGSRRPGRPAAPTAPPAPRRRSVLHDLRAGALRRRADLDAEICIEAVAELATELPPIADLGDDDVLAYRTRLLDLALRTAAAEMAVAAGATAAYRKIELLVMPHLGEQEAGRHAERVTTGRGVVVAADPDASAATFGGPTWRELDRAPVTPPTAPAPTRAWNELQRALEAASSWGGDTLRAVLRLRALRRIVEDAVTLLHRREAAKAALLRLGGEVRRIDLELGRRLEVRGTLAGAADIELLTTVELRDALAGTPPAPPIIAGRRRWLQRYGAEPPLPVRFVGRPRPAPVELPPGGRLEGWAASPGRHVGEGHVVHNADEQIPDGAVLVAAATDASWSPLFLTAGAIVVERGGPLSHAAILARELGVPAVLNVPGATQHLDGATLTVDGDAGVVVVHEASP